MAKRNFRKKKKNNDFLIYFTLFIIIISILIITYLLVKLGKEPIEKTKTVKKVEKKRESRKIDYVSKTFVEDFLFLNDIKFSEYNRKNYMEFRINIKENDYSIIKTKFKLYTDKRGYIFKSKKISAKKFDWFLFKNDSLKIEIIITLVKARVQISVKKPHVAIIIDDIGNNRDSINKLSKIDFDFAFSILPNSRFINYGRDLAKKYGKQVMVHLPLEPIKSNGYRLNLNGFLLVSMRDELIENYTEEYLDLIPEAKGVNNHTGSLFTTRADKMKIILEIIKRRGLFFIDSKTTAKTIAYNLSKKMNIPSGIRDIFIDGDNKKITILNFKHLFSIAKRKGFAIGIGHPKPETIKVMSEKVKKIAEKYKVELVFPSKIVK